MKIIIAAITDDDKKLYYAGYEDTQSAKGLGSGALTGTNRVYLSLNRISKIQKS